MSKRVKLCPNCKSRLTKIITINDTNIFNATLQCIDCKHEWKDKISSKIYQIFHRNNYPLWTDEEYKDLVEYGKEPIGKVVT